MLEIPAKGHGSAQVFSLCNCQPFWHTSWVLRNTVPSRCERRDTARAFSPCIRQLSMPISWVHFRI